MATGAIRRSTARYGLRASQRVGLPIMMGAGPGSNHGDGHGWMMNLGASHRSTMDDGPTWTTDGAGAPARLRRVCTMLPRWSLSSVAEDSAWVSRLAVGAAAWSAGSL